MKTLAIAFAALCATTFCVGPFIWQIVASLTADGGGFTLHHYVSIFEGRSFGQVILNSFIVAGATTGCCIVVGAPAAFALAKLELAGGRLLLGAALVVSMFPPIATVSPLFLILRGVGLRDQLAGLVLPYTTFALPLAIWVLTSFFRQIPDDLYGAARVDGCSPLQAFWKIFLPLSAPSLATTAILIFIFAWNEFLYALTFISSPGKRTIPVAISLFATGQTDPWPEIFAASTVTTLPLILLTIALQRRIVSGLTAGAIKG